MRREGKKARLRDNKPLTTKLLTKMRAVPNYLFNKVKCSMYMYFDENKMPHEKDNL